MNKRLFVQGHQHVLVRDSVGHAPLKPVDERICVKYDASCIITLVELLPIGSRTLLFYAACRNAPMNSIAVLL